MMIINIAFFMFYSSLGIISKFKFKWFNVDIQYHNVAGNYFIFITIAALTNNIRMKIVQYQRYKVFQSLLFLFSNKYWAPSLAHPLAWLEDLSQRGVTYMKSSGFIWTILLVGTKLQEKEQAFMTYAFPLFFIYSVCALNGKYS